MSSYITIPKVCLHCKGAFIAKTTVTKFCSQKCASKAYKAKQKMAKVEQAQTLEYQKVQGIDMQLIQAKEFLSVKETCLLLGISRTTLYRLFNGRAIQPNRVGGKVIIKRQIINEIIG